MSASETLWTPPLNATVAVDLVLSRFRPDDMELEVLLITRRYPPFENMFALPGGIVEATETVEQAAARELCEETGVTVLPQHLTRVGVYSLPERDPRGRVISIGFKHHVSRWPKVVAGDDAKAAFWARPFEVINRPMAFDHAQILRDSLGARIQYARYRPGRM